MRGNPTKDNMGGHCTISNRMRDRRVEKALDKYVQGSITLPKASEIAGIDTYEMIALLEKRRIPYRYDISDLEDCLKRCHD